MTSRGRERAAGSHPAQVVGTNGYSVESLPLRGPVEKMTTEVIHAPSVPFAPPQWGHLPHRCFLPWGSSGLARSRGPVPGSKAPLHSAEPESRTSSLLRVRPMSPNGCSADKSHVKIQSRTACLLHAQISPHPRTLLSVWSSMCPAPCLPLGDRMDTDEDFSGQLGGC